MHALQWLQVIVFEGGGCKCAHYIVDCCCLSARWRNELETVSSNGIADTKGRDPASRDRHTLPFDRQTRSSSAWILRCAHSL